MQKLIDKARDEIAFVWITVMTAVNALQLAAVSLPDAVHVTVLVGTAVLTAWGIRAQVTPATKIT